MNRFIDADAFLEDECEAYIRAQSQIDDTATRLVNSIVHRKVQMLIKDAPTADVVSRDQYNLLYDECLRLRTLNEQLMDSLRETEDDGK